MNPWEIFLGLLSWLGLLAGLFLVLVIFWAIMEGLWKALKKIILSERDELSTYLREAHAVVNNFHADGSEPSEEFQQGFLAGTRWGWGYHHRISRQTQIKRQR